MKEEGGRGASPARRTDAGPLRLGRQKTKEGEPVAGGLGDFLPDGGKALVLTAVIEEVVFQDLGLVLDALVAAGEDRARRRKVRVA
jgi:hypothetical protein